MSSLEEVDSGCGVSCLCIEGLWFCLALVQVTSRLMGNLN